MKADAAGGRVAEELAANAPELLAYFERRVQPADAADLLAEVMLAAWRRASELPADPERARMWLYVTARNVLANAQRGERRRWRLANRLRLLVQPVAAPDAGEGAEVREAIARLDPELAELIRLVHWDGLTLAEAAEVQGIPASTARGRYQRAKSELREALAPV
ncbi:RNA polymerase sigma factor [Protaetiibacter intestinalis]|uniref:Sigma-70 family RNA polymerase sigma factor n=1 Tax=Protaetiibacter intestinalis TaxID=2419774 RepID=A0A387B7S5_9MICO|nr:sigma-70 family RNA polymerase sigma factor [Protaetiibacter intestinalis]AYF97798.1 sigma-70 family RNA polymerase sigma factor [Protaetiibacter intestinalis]